MTRFVVLFCALFALANAQSTAVSRCQSNPGDLPINTHIQGCTTPPCALPQLQNAVIDITFRAPRAIQSMRTLATAYMTVGPVTIPVPHDLGANSITCNFLTNARCPLRSGEVVTTRLRMFIESSFPVGTRVTIEFRVVDQGNSPVLCLRVPITVVRPRSLEASDNVVVEEIEQH